RDDAGAAWARLGPAPCILEAWVPFERELSVIVARGADGGIASYVPVENRH
ncbi:ATP-grasp domain-containing protein, partial [Vibrio parahaemolyticus]